VTQESKWLASPTVAVKALLAVPVVYLVGVYGHFLLNGMPFDPVASTYVTINPKDTDLFLNDLGSIAKSHGLESARASATPDDGRTTYVFEARGRALRIYAQNVLLSGNECVDFPRVGSDPGQFSINVLPAIWLPLRDRATTLFEIIRKDLSHKGYRLSARPSTPCDRTNRWSGRVRDKVPSSYIGVRAALLNRQVSR
jgi:hypothetical protein